MKIMKSQAIILPALLLMLTLPAAEAQRPSYKYSRVDHYLNRGDRFMREYRFAEAREAYAKASDVLRDSSRTSEITDRQLLLENAVSMLDYCSTPTVIRKERFPIEQFYLLYPMRDSTWRAFPNDLDPAPKHPVADAAYLPDGLPVYYFSAADEAGCRNIYFTQQEDSLWSVPALLSEALVSTGDEIFPVLSPDGKKLYFASNGLYGVGGYDIYASTWDETAQEWGAPVNVGYPFSSPADDFLLTSTEDGRYTLFASNRECAKDSVVIYVLEHEAVPARKTVTEEELRTLMLLVPTGEEPPAAEEEAEPEPEAEEPALLRAYRDSIARIQELQGAVAENGRALDMLRGLYGRADYETRTALSDEILERERRQPVLRDSLKLVTAAVQRIELEMTGEGIAFDAPVLRPQEAPVPEVPAFDPFAFVKRDYGARLDFAFEKPEDFDYAFMILDEGRFAKDNTLPDGIVYQIHLFSSASHASVKDFKGLSPVFERPTDSGRYFYAVGVFRTYQDVLAHLNSVKRLGFRNAYVTAYRNGKSIRVAEARRAEQR